MKFKSKSINELIAFYQEASTISQINSVLGWDLNVNLPPKASITRAQQSAFLTKLSTDKWKDPKIKKLLVAAEKDARTKEEKAVVRNMKKASEYYHLVPQELIIKFSKLTSESFMVWNKAKRENKFSDFAPYLKEIVEINKLIAKHLRRGYKEDPYDALLDLYEPELTTKMCRKYFNQLQPELTLLIKKIQKSKAYPKTLPYIGSNYYYPPDDQKQLSLFALRKIGYDLEAGRLDPSPHPFTIPLGNGDVRVTTKYTPTDFRDALTSTIHEGGHALYEQGSNPEYINTPLEGGISLGIHESQSRFWENQVGRSSEFLKFLIPVLQTLYSQQLGHATHEELALLFNYVKPGLIRIEADEVTYTLHIILRFELEHALINGKLDVKDLPAAWNEKMKNYLGVTPKTDSEGVLQDVHWSYGSLGYFPTYALGNLYGAQLAHTMSKEIDLNQAISDANFAVILSWLRTNVHKYSSLYLPQDLIKKVTGEALSAKYYLSYINKKYKALYHVS